MRRIEPHRLWIGHAGDARDYSTLIEEGVQAIVHIALEEPSPAPPRDFILVRVPLVDGGGNDPALLRLAVSCTVKLIDSGIGTLVCCGAGMSRSPAIVAATLSQIEDCNAQDCLKRITKGQPADASPILWMEIMHALDQK